MLASRADVYTIRCSCKQWPCTYTAPCVARTCWEESQTHIAAPLWQRRSTHPARTLMHAANVPRRGKSCTDQQHHTIRPPDSTKARPTIKQDRLFLLHDGAGRRPAETIGKNHTARPPPALPAASIFRRGDQPQIRQGENHQHDHSPAPNKSGPALEADRRPRRE